MVTQLLVSTALVTTQVNRQPQSVSPGRDSVSRNSAARPVAASMESEVEATAAPATAKSAGQAVLRQNAPNSALTTYRDQDSGRLIVRVYDRESGDVLVEFPPERAFRPAGVLGAAAASKPSTNFSV